MKTINYKGIELEVHDSTVVHTYGNRGNVDIEFNKPIYSFEGRTFYSLYEVNEYLARATEVFSQEEFKIFRVLPKNKSIDKYAMSIVYSIKEGLNLHTILPTFEMALEFVNEKLKPKSQFQNDIPFSSSTNDNRLAIKMLNSVSEILSAIESDDADLIELNLTELKERVDKFHKVYYDNKQKGMYE